MVIAIFSLSVFLYARNKELKTVNTTLDQELNIAQQSITPSQNQTNCIKKLKQTQKSTTP
jgi:hypothetical protein